MSVVRDGVFRRVNLGRLGFAGRVGKGLVACQVSAFY